MAPRIGFVLLTHNEPEQLLRLARRLTALYDHPPIAIHHDFGKCPLNVEFSKNIAFVRPHIDTKWGTMTCVDAFLAGLRVLYSRPDSPDWFALLSGADYPVRSPEEVLRDLEAGGVDAYLDHRVVERPHIPHPRDNEPHGCRSPGWVPTAYDRYIAMKPWIPGFSWKRRKPVKLRLMTIRSPFLVKPFVPFSPAFRCYGGEWWFTANRKSAERLLEDSPITRTALRHFRKRFIPDEAAVHTMLCNQPGLKVSRDFKRYVDWSAGGPHPKTLGMEDIPRIVESGAHFARKFHLKNGSGVFDEIDRIVDQKVRI